MTRRPSRNVTFATLNLPLESGEMPPGPTEIVVSTGDLNYDFAAAGHFLIGHTLSDCLQLEGVYTGVVPASNLEAARDNTLNDKGGEGLLFSPFSNFGVSEPVLGLDYNNYASIRYTSSLQSAELNVRRRVPDPPWEGTASILFGVRYVGLPEHLYYHTESDVPREGGTIGAINDIHVATANEMVGPQVGIRFESYAADGWWVNAEIKGALLNNCCRETSTYTETEAGETYPSSQSGTHTSFAGELSITSVYRWSPYFTTRLGYQGLFLSDVALAQDNFNTTIDFYTHYNTQLSHSDGIMYHALFAGVEFAR